MHSTLLSFINFELTFSFLLLNFTDSFGSYVLIFHIFNQHIFCLKYLCPFLVSLCSHFLYFTSLIILTHFLKLFPNINFTANYASSHFMSIMSKIGLINLFVFSICYPIFPGHLYFEKTLKCL